MVASLPSSGTLGSGSGAGLGPLPPHGQSLQRPSPSRLKKQPTWEPDHPVPRLHPSCWSRVLSSLLLWVQDVLSARSQEVPYFRCSADVAVGGGACRHLPMPPASFSLQCGFALVFLSPILVWWFCITFLHFSFLNALCLCSEILSCGYSEVYRTCLIGDSMSFPFACTT